MPNPKAPEIGRDIDGDLSHSLLGLREARSTRSVSGESIQPCPMLLFCLAVVKNSADRIQMQYLEAIRACGGDRTGHEDSKTCA
jgi:hypothetical protein